MINDIITERIEFLRKKNRLRKIDIAELLRLTPITVSQRLHNHTMWSAEDISILADYFGVTTDYIFGRSNDGREERSNDTEHP